MNEYARAVTCDVSLCTRMYMYAYMYIRKACILLDG